MELLPQSLAVVLAVPVAPEGLKVDNGPVFDFDRLNRVFGELARSHNYRSFQASPDGKSGQITGTTLVNAIIFNPPLIQFQQQIEFTVDQAAEAAADAFRVIDKHLQLGIILQMGVRLIFHGAVPDKDARAFVLNRLLSKTDDDLGDLSRGGQTWVGMKYVVPDAENTSTYTVTAEPLLINNELLYVDLDGEFRTGNTVEVVKQRITEMSQYSERVLRHYFEKI